MKIQVTGINPRKTPIANAQVAMDQLKEAQEHLVHLRWLFDQGELTVFTKKEINDLEKDLFRCWSNGGGRSNIFGRSLDAIRYLQRKLSEPDGKKERMYEQLWKEACECLAEEMSKNLCGSCAGTGTPISGRPCMCGGTGKASDAVPYLLKRIQWLTDSLAQAWFDGYAAKEAGLSSYKADDRRRNFLNSIEDGQ